MRSSPSWAAIAAGAVGLAVLDGIVSSKAAASNVGGILAGTGRAVQWFLSPAVPAFKTGSSSTTAATAAATQAAYAAPPAGSTPPSSSAANKPTGSPAPTPTGGPVYVPSPNGPILEYAA